MSAEPHSSTLPLSDSPASLQSTSNNPQPSHHDSSSPSHIYTHPTLNKPICHINFFLECPKYAHLYKACMSKWYDSTPEITMATQCMREWVGLERCMALQVRYGSLDISLDEEMLSQLEDEKDVGDMLDGVMRRDPYVNSTEKYFKMKYGMDLV